MTTYWEEQQPSGMSWAELDPTFRTRWYGAAVPLPRTTVRHRLAQALSRIPVAWLSDLRPPRPRRNRSRHDYLERSFMAREMLRL
jgi:hypothetical protein